MDYLRYQPSERDLRQISALGLAHLGDGVFEMMARAKILSMGALTPKNLHKATVDLVKAQSQSAMAATLVPLLDEEEEGVFRRGRNAKPNIIPKTATRAEYAQATALETLFGYLYLKGRYDRLNELFEQLIAEKKD